MLVCYYYEGRPMEPSDEFFNLFLYLPVDGEETKEMVDQALFLYNSNLPVSSQLKLQRITKSFFTAVAGRLYDLTFDATTLNNETKTYDAQVWVKIGGAVQLEFLKEKPTELGQGKTAKEEKIVPGSDAEITDKGNYQKAYQECIDMVGALKHEEGPSG